MTPVNIQETWNEYRNLVLAELKNLNQGQKDANVKIEEGLNDLLEKLHTLDMRLNTVETKMYIISGIIGTASSIGIAIIKIIFEKYF